MKKKNRIVVLASCLIFLVSFQMGCERRYVRLDVKDLSSLKPQRLTHSTHPHIRGHHSGLRAAGTVLVFVALIPGIVVGQIASHKDRDLSRDIASAGIPDIGKLLVSKFADRASRELPNWPVPLVEEQSQWDWRRYVEEFIADGSGSLIVFFAEKKTLSTGDGFIAYFKAVMWSHEGDIIWLKGFEYSSEDYERKRSLEEYRADNFMLLKEEIDFAVDRAVSEFIASILKGYDEEMLQPTADPEQTLESINEFNEMEQPDCTHIESGKSTDGPKNMLQPSGTSSEISQPMIETREVEQPSDATEEIGQSINEPEEIE